MRRHLGTFLASGLSVALAATAVLSLRLDDTGPGGLPAGAVHSAEAVAAPASAGVRGVQTPLGLSARGNGATGVIRPGHFSQVAVTWRGQAPAVQVSTHTRGAWTGWKRLPALEDLDSAEGNGTRGTELMPVGPSDAVKVRVSGGHARGLTVVTIDPGANPQIALASGTITAADSTTSTAGATGSTSTATASTDATSTATATVSTSASMSASTSTSAATTSAAASPSASVPPGSALAPPAYTPPAHYAPMPYVRSRAAWGANESLRNDGPFYNLALQQMHVHHTASTNRYSRAAVPGLLRGMYWYHTQSLGWADIGYNFLIDRFGRIWEGRAGGVVQNVRGAHTLGFNHQSFGVAMIGNFESARPTRRALTSLVRLAAWKLDYYQVPQVAGSTQTTSQGSDRQAAGSSVVLPVIDGHRDTNQTACPGRYLYAKLPSVRQRVQARVNAY